MAKDNSQEAAGLSAGLFEPGYAAGLDEVGMGALAGPITVAVVAFPVGYPKIEGVADSKKLSRKRREELVPLIIEKASFVGIGWTSPAFIDENGMKQAWYHACAGALRGIENITCLHVDGIIEVSKKAFRGRQITYIRGDDLVWQISAASIVAKVSRDYEMVEMAQHYPGYGFKRNVGYGTKEHHEAILRKGFTPIHRKMFLKKMLRKHKEATGEVVGESMPIL